ncbi:MAG: VWA domain-containing protein, partial [Thiomargarita sp.]|nr:VWA domain-containing protein [Thiomargarita sp.]
MLYFFLIVCALWIGIGSLLLYLKSRAAGTSAFLRHVDKRIYNRTDTINISITLTSPCAISSSLENHDILLVLDHSISMGAAPGSPLRESIRAMENFVQQMPDSYHIGLIIFDHEAQRL